MELKDNTIFINIACKTRLNCTFMELKADICRHIATQEKQALIVPLWN